MFHEIESITTQEEMDMPYNTNFMSRESPSSPSGIKLVIGSTRWIGGHGLHSLGSPELIRPIITRMLVFTNIRVSFWDNFLPSLWHYWWQLNLRYLNSWDETGISFPSKRKLNELLVRVEFFSHDRKFAKLLDDHYRLL